MIDYFQSLDFRQQVVVGIVVGIALSALTIVGRSIFRPLKRRLVRYWHRPTLVFVSTGGTCRDPMAKVIAEKLLSDRKPKVQVFAAGISKGHSKRAAKGARYVVQEAMGEDLLKNHRTCRLKESLVAKADLILAMEPVYVKEIVKLFPDAGPKTHTIHGFLGIRGVIENPYRSSDQLSEKAFARYRSCFEKLQAILAANIEKIHAAVTLEPRPWTRTAATLLDNTAQI